MVFDPLLPRGMLADLRAGSGSLIITDVANWRPASHRFRTQRAVFGAAVYCAAMTLVVVLELGAGTFWSWAAGTATAFAYIPPNRIDRSMTFRESMKIGLSMLFWAIWAAALSGLFGSVILQFGLLHLGVCLWFVLMVKGGTTHIVGRDHVISTDDLVGSDLRYMRSICERVERAQRLLAPTSTRRPSSPRCARPNGRWPHE